MTSIDRALRRLRSAPLLPALGAAALMTGVLVAVPALAAAPAQPAAAATAAVPGAGNTGVPAGTTLKKVYGDIVVKTPGTVLNALDVHGRIVVRAANVTVSNSIIRGTDSGSINGLIETMIGAPNLVVKNSEIVASKPNYQVNGVMGWNFTLSKVNIHGVVDAVDVAGGNVTVADSWLHNNLHFAYDPGHSNGSHDDSIQVQSGSHIRITNDTMSGAHTGAVTITQDAGTVSDLAIASSHIDGGACSVNISQGRYSPISGLSITNDVFGRTTTYRDCAIVVTGSTRPALSGNHYTDGLVPTIVQH